MFLRMKTLNQELNRELEARVKIVPLAQVQGSLSYKTYVTYDMLHKYDILHLLKWGAFFRLSSL